MGRHEGERSRVGWEPGRHERGGPPLYDAGLGRPGVWVVYAMFWLCVTAACAVYMVTHAGDVIQVRLRRGGVLPIPGWLVGLAITAVAGACVFSCVRRSIVERKRAAGRGNSRSIVPNGMHAPMGPRGDDPTSRVARRVVRDPARPASTPTDSVEVPGHALRGGFWSQNSPGEKEGNDLWYHNSRMRKGPRWLYGLLMAALVIFGLWLAVTDPTGYLFGYDPYRRNMQNWLFGGICIFVGSISLSMYWRQVRIERFQDEEPPTQIAPNL